MEEAGGYFVGATMFRNSLEGHALSCSILEGIKFVPFAAILRTGKC